MVGAHLLRTGGSVSTDRLGHLASHGLKDASSYQPVIHTGRRDGDEKPTRRYKRSDSGRHRTAAFQAHCGWNGAKGLSYSIAALDSRNETRLESSLRQRKQRDGNAQDLQASSLGLVVSYRPEIPDAQR